MQVGLSQVTVLDGDPAHHPLKGGGARVPQFSAHIYCCQMAAWIKMPLALGMEVDLSLGDIVLDGDPAAPPPKGAQTPNFRPMSVVPKRLDGLRCHLVCRKASAQATVFDAFGPSSPSEKKAQPPPNSQPMSIVAKLMDGRRRHLVRKYISVQATLCYDGDPAPPQKEHSSPPLFGPCLLWPWSPISATAELLFLYLF